MYKVYAIKSQKEKRIYVGYSKDSIKRLKEHNDGYCRSTKGYRPWELLFEEEVTTLKQALKLEKYYKSGSGKKRLLEILNMAL